MVRWDVILPASAATLAALIAAFNAYLLARFNRRITERVEDWKGSVSDRSFFLEQSYAREYEIYRELWPSILEIRTNIEVGDLAIDRSAKINLPKDKLEDRAKRLSDKIHDALGRIEQVQPFVPTKVHAMIKDFTMLAISKGLEWRFADFSKVTPESAAKTEEIKVKAEEILDALRKRLSWQPAP